ncbi:MAG: hypothetical protein UV60_C0013G0002 [Parcubacteria group bacterium GW2011_GWA2_43_11]|nr:MAG: hypothetical protein UV60_C0013G0002 [Parcubacteria group bacterium GW2011_GWA2_43_11]
MSRCPGLSSRWMIRRAHPLVGPPAGGGGNCGLRLGAETRDRTADLPLRLHLIFP